MTPNIGNRKAVSVPRLVCYTLKAYNQMYTAPFLGEPQKQPEPLVYGLRLGVKIC
mgnify:CR=1 FL=1